MGILPHQARRVLHAVPRARRGRAGQRRVHRPDRPGLCRQHRRHRRRGHPAGNQRRKIGRAQARVRRGGRDPCWQLVPNIRRRSGVAGDDLGNRDRARLDATRSIHRRRRDRRRSGADVDRPHSGHRESAEQGRCLDLRHRRVRGERGLRSGSVGLARRNRRRPGSAQPPRRSHRAGAPAWRIRRGADDPHGTSYARQRDSVRIADHVRGRRHRQRDNRRTRCLTGEFMRRDLFAEDHEAFRELAGDFVEKEVVPAYPEWEKGGRVPRDVFKKMGALGMLGMAVPEQYGGAGMPDYRYNVVLQEEAARALVTLSTVRTQLEVILPYFLHYANDEQRKRWFPGLADGTLLTAVAMTEPGTGSDLAGMRTAAVRDGDHWIVNGAKTFITGGMQADLVIVVARTSTDPDNRRKGLTLLVIEDGMDGFTPGRELEKMG